MSVKMMTAVWELQLRAPQQQLLLAMADHADDDGVCWPSAERLGWKTGMSRSTVFRQLQKLKTEGLLEVVKEGSRHNPVVYRLHLENGVKKPPFKGVVRSEW